MGSPPTMMHDLTHPKLGGLSQSHGFVDAPSNPDVAQATFSYNPSRPITTPSLLYEAVRTPAADENFLGTLVDLEIATQALRLQERVP